LDGWRVIILPVGISYHLSGIEGLFFCSSVHIDSHRRGELVPKGTVEKSSPRLDNRIADCFLVLITVLNLSKSTSSLGNAQWDVEKRGILSAVHMIHKIENHWETW
jgi:hypothetical protein